MPAVVDLYRSASVAMAVINGPSFLALKKKKEREREKKEKDPGFRNQVPDETSHLILACQVELL